MSRERGYDALGLGFPPSSLLLVVVVYVATPPQVVVQSHTDAFLAVSAARKGRQVTETQAPTRSGSPPEPSPKPSTPATPTAYITKNPPGRPRKDRERSVIPPLPRPASFKGINAAQFIDYWRKTDAKFPSRLAVYVYRNWPVIDRVRCGKNKYIDVLSVGESPDAVHTDDIANADQFETFMFHRFGSGDYKLILNDGGLSREVCQVYAKYRDANILPIVEPLETLVVEDPINRPYIEALMRKGVKIPGTYQEQEEENDVAKVTTELTSTVDKLVDRNIQMADRVVEAATQRRDEEEANRQRSPQSPDALETSLRIVSTAADMGSKIVGSAMQKAGEIQAAVVAKEVSPVETMRGFVDLANSLHPPVPTQPPSTDSAILNLLVAKMIEREAASAQAAAEAVQSQNQLLRDIMFGGRFQSPTLPGGSPGIAPADGGAAPLQPGLLGVPAAAQSPKTMLDSIKELSAAKDELQNLLGLGGEEETGVGGKQSFWERNLPTMLQAGMLIANTVATAIYNLAVAKSGQGQPATPTSLSQLSQQGQPEPLLAPLPLSQQSPAVSATDPNLAAYHQFLATLKDPLLQSINNNDSGFDFAEKMVNWQGDMAYQFLRELGPDRLLSILSTYPPIWEFVSKIPNRFSQFLQEFLDYGAPEDVPPAATAAPAPTGPVPAAVHRARASRAPTQSPSQAPQAPPVDPMSADPLRASPKKGVPTVSIS